MLKSIHFAGNDFVLTKEELDSELVSNLEACAASGDVSSAVAHVVRTYPITGNMDDCAEYLRGYGAWDSDELEDHEKNIGRLVWLSGCQLSEEGEIYFSAY